MILDLQGTVPFLFISCELFSMGRSSRDFLTEPGIRQGGMGGVGGMKKRKISNFIRCDLKVLAKTEKEITIVFPPSKLLTKLLTTVLCCKV